MYERQFGLRENPFAAGHQSKFVYPSREHQEALAHLRFGIENREAFVLITGEVGTGKTTALYDALSEWKSRALVALITNTALTRSELYEEICMRFGVPISGPTSKPQLIQQLERHLLVVRARGDYAILLIDEAQNLDSGLLEETRLLSNLDAQGQKLLQIFLVGQPELEDKLAQPELRQLRQRIAVHYRLRPLSVDETEHYIHHRIAVAGGNAHTVFPSDACAEVHTATHGIPREINTVAAQALLNAFVEDATSVKPEHVRAIVRDTGFQSVLDATDPRATSAPAVAAPAVASPAVAAPTTPPSNVSPPAAASPVPVSPPLDAPAHTREVRHVPTPAPAVPRGPGAAPPTTNEPEGHTMAGVRPAGSTESWQSWMQSLANIPADQKEGTPGAEADAASAAATPAPPSTSTGEARPEMTPEEFYAVEEAALRVPIGDEEYEDAIGGENDEGPSDLDAEVEEDVEYEEQAGEPAMAASDDSSWLDELTKAGSVAPVQAAPPEASTAPAAQFENAPGLNWGDNSSRSEEPATAARSERPAPPMPEAETPSTWHPEPVAATRPEPAMARVSAAPAQPMTTARALPLRLRERLDAAEREEASDSSKMTGWLIGIAAVAAVVMAVLLVMKMRNQSAATSPTPTEVAATATETPAVSETPAGGAGSSGGAPTSTGTLASDPASGTSAATPPIATPAPPRAQVPSVAATTPRTQPAATRPAATSAGATTSQPVAAKPEATPPAQPKSTVAAVAAPMVPKTVRQPAAPKAQYGVSVASYLAEGRATAELARLSAATGVAGRVVTTPEGDYKVVLGSYPDRTAAENAAGKFIDGGKVDEARVVSLGTTTKK